MLRSGYDRQPSKDNTAHEAKDIIKDVLKELFTHSDFHELLANCIDKAIGRQMQKIQEEQERQEGKIFVLEQNLEKRDAEILLIKTSMEELSKACKGLQNNLNSLEQYSRRNCLRVFGLPSQSDEDTTDLILTLANSKLNVNIEGKDIDRSHRIGPTRPGNNKHHSIIVKFTSYQTRDLVIRNRRKLEGTGIVIKEDLTMENQKLLKATTENPKVSTAWTKDGNIFALIQKDGKDSVKKVKTNKDLKDWWFKMASILFSCIGQHSSTQPVVKFTCVF